MKEGARGMPASEECERKDRLRPMRVAHRSQSELFASKLRVAAFRSCDIDMPYSARNFPVASRYSILLLIISPLVWERAKVVWEMGLSFFR